MSFINIYIYSSNENFFKKNTMQNLFMLAALKKLPVNGEKLMRLNFFVF